MTFAEAKKSPLLYLFLLAVFGMVFATSAALQIPAYLTDIGYGSAVAARVVAAYSAVAIAGKLILGSVIDKFGEKTGSAYICIVGILAFICFVLAKNRIFLYGIILFWGLGSGITSVLPTLLTSKIFGKPRLRPHLRHRFICKPFRRRDRNSPGIPSVRSYRRLYDHLACLCSQHGARSGSHYDLSEPLRQSIRVQR